MCAWVTVKQRVTIEQRLVPKSTQMEASPDEPATIEIELKSLDDVLKVSHLELVLARGKSARDDPELLRAIEALAKAGVGKRMALSLIHI